MAGDRRAALILQAAAQGVVDFTRFDPFDRNWWLRLKWLLQELEATNLRQLLVCQNSRHAGALGTATNPQLFEHHWKASGEVLQNLASLLFPWENKETDRRSEYEKLRQQYLAYAGDPQDQVTQERIRVTLESLKSKRQEKQPRGKPRARA